MAMDIEMRPDADAAEMDFVDMQPVSLETDDCYRPDDVVVLDSEVPDGYRGILFGRYNPETGVHYAWLNRATDEAPVAMITDREADEVPPGIPLHGFRDGGELAFMERMEGEWRPLRLERFSSEQSLHSRNAGLGIGMEAIAKKRAVIVGCGSVGSQIAELLCRAGVRHFTLVDADVVEYHNLSRTFDTSLLGAYKTRAVARRLQMIAPNAQITTYESMLEGITDDTFYASLKAPDCVLLSCADSRASDAVANQLCARSGVPFLSCGFWPRAAVCENFLWQPNHGDQLYGDVFDEVIKRDAIVEHYANYTTANDGIRVIQPGLAISIAVGNAISAQLALDVLMAPEEGYISRLARHMPSQYLLFCNTPDQTLAGKDAAAIFHKPLECICPGVHA